ncbi:MAG: RNA 3'-terminal phosphate cyclase [Candidatus Latescibacterota bacterium]|jgi:RNA 3'-terminal phosphate cyclase (ATP)
MSSPLEIDGSYGEGGGQILRTALGLAALTGQPFVMTNIRSQRTKPGLMPQHLTGILAMADVCGARVEGAKMGSTDIEFEPGERARPGEYTFDVADVAHGGSAGSVTLLLQSLLVPLALAPGASKLTLKGGTHVAWSPSYDFVVEVLFPVLKRMGITATAKLVSWGFFPKGGGRINVEIEPAESLLPLVLAERGELKLIHGRAVACNLKSHIAVRMINRARNLLSGLGVPVQINPERVKAQSTGAALFLRAEYENVTVGFTALGEPRKPSEKVAEEACAELMEYIETDAPFTPHLSDQLLLPAAFADGRSEIRTSRITSHLMTNAHVIGLFLPDRVRVEGDEGEPGVVVVEGTAP